MEETEFQINVLEWMAIYFGMQSLCGNVRDTHVKVLTGNTTAVHSVNNMSSCKSLSRGSEVRKIWNLVIMRNNFKTATHIPGIMNVEADELRKSDIRTKWKLNESFLHSNPSVDLFASRIKTGF